MNSKNSLSGICYGIGIGIFYEFKIFLSVSIY